MLLRHLFEAEALSVPDIDELIERDCQSFLSENKTARLFRGMQNPDSRMVRWFDSERETGIGSVRNNRAPTNSSEAITKVLNKFFVDVTGVPLRTASLFCSTNVKMAQAYASHKVNTTYEIYPIGEYHTVHSPIIKDAYWLDEVHQIPARIIQRIKDLTDVNLNDEDFHEFSSGYLKAIDKIIRTPGIYVFDGELHKGFDTEVMLLCDKYYLKRYKPSES